MHVASCLAAFLSRMRHVIGPVRDEGFLVSILCILTLLYQAVSAGAQSNGVLREVWFDVGGVNVSDLTKSPAYRASPDERAEQGVETETSAGERDGREPVRWVRVDDARSDHY